jgi:hypothetical protein
MGVEDAGGGPTWLTTWHEMANGVLDDVGVNARFRRHPQSEDLDVNARWQFVVTELRRHPVRVDRRP